ncbi:hypothetical protein [Rhodococcoides fascians]|uniref:hypothetical protein n=1 Tax=Rhodococcoides fascians TaxID=1828 RepID=UPI001D81BEF6|nr:hypothetical protein [Rhodococcus fascians]CAH0236036.1 hypothetical protein SRABI91_02758 [Rhodococcus fascians]
MAGIPVTSAVGLAAIDVSRFRVRAFLDPTDRAVPFRFVALCHRRGMVMVSLDLDITPAAGSEMGRVKLVFDSTEQQALILARSLEAVVGVVGIDLDPV